MLALSAMMSISRRLPKRQGRSSATFCSRNLVLVARLTRSIQVATTSFVNSGQVCIGVKRIYVQESIYDKFLAAFAEYAKSLKIGDGFQDGVFLGPLQNKRQFQIAQKFLSDVELQNLKVVLGDSPTPAGSGLYVSPTIVDRPPDTSELVTEEPFGK